MNRGPQCRSGTAFRTQRPKAVYVCASRFSYSWIVPGYRLPIVCAILSPLRLWRPRLTFLTSLDTGCIVTSVLASSVVRRCSFGLFADPAFCSRLLRRPRLVRSADSDTDTRVNTIRSEKRVLINAVQRKARLFRARDVPSP